MKYEDIKPFIEKGLVSERSHPEDENVRIFNYTQACQFSGEWNDITKQCRGLILNIATGEIVARPFPKFFNYQEHVAKEWPIPVEEEPIIAEKMDGSLGILYELNGKPWIATRGSFTSDQALWATDWWRSTIGMLPEKGVTELFEIIYPQNRIVVNYNFSGLVHLSTIDNKSGMQIPHIGRWPDVRTPKYFQGKNLKELSCLEETNSEGFVCYFPNANVRIKIKFPEYVRLHKIMTGLSEIGIWEMLRDGKDILEIVKDVPDEMFSWIKGVAADLLERFVDIERIATQTELDVKNLPTRKEQALIVSKSRYPSVVFAMLDNKDHKEIIWRMLRPHGQKTFKVDIDQ